MTVRRTSAVASLAVLASLAASSASTAPLKVGSVAPPFTLTDQSGKAVSLADYAGKVVVLEWFNDGCPFVQKHYKTGAMNALAAKYASKGVVWLAVNSTDAANGSTNGRAATKYEIKRPILDDSAGNVGHLYGATNTPDLFVIDTTGKLAYRGAIDSVVSADPDDLAGATNYVAAALDDVLAGKPVARSETKPYGCTVKYAK